MLLMLLFYVNYCRLLSHFLVGWKWNMDIYINWLGKIVMMYLISFLFSLIMK